MSELLEPTVVLAALDPTALWAMLSPENFSAWVEQYPQWAPLIAIGFAIFVSMTPLPMETIAIANGMWFGPIVGGILTWVGAMVAAILAFLIAKLIGFPLVSRCLPKKAFERMQEAVENHGPSTLVMVRMIPLIPFTVINYGAGVTTVSWRTFLWTSGVGMLPPTILWVALGDMMRTRPLVAVAFLVVLALASFFAIKLTRRRWDASHDALSD